MEVAVVDFLPQSRVCLKVRGGKGDGSELETRAFVNLSSQSFHAENSDLVLHQRDQWTNDQYYSIGFGECHALECHAFAGAGLRANHDVLASKETVMYSGLPISDLW